MADEQTTQNDTTSSATDANEAASTEQQAQPAETGDGASTEQSGAETEGSALGNAGLKDKTEGDKPAEGEDGGEEEAATGAPEKYEFNLEGVDLDQEALAEAEPILRELNLSNEDANKLLPAANALVEKTRDGMMQQLGDAVKQQKSDWLEAAKADETIGGAKFDENLGLAAKALDALGFKEGHPFRQALDDTGFGNHRDMIFAFSEIGRMVGEDGNFVRTDAGGPMPSAKDILYGNSNEKGSS